MAVFDAGVFDPNVFDCGVIATVGEAGGAGKWLGEGFTFPDDLAGALHKEQKKREKAAKRAAMSNNDRVAYDLLEEWAELYGGD